MDKLISLIWVAILGAVVAILAIPGSREVFKELTTNSPYLMGFIKIAILGTMGELLGGKIASGRWQLTGIRLYQRILVWGFLGLVFTAVFPLFSFGVEGILTAGLIPGGDSALLTAFWKSFFMNIIFGFEMMIFHRFTDTLIDRGELFTIWPVVDVFTDIDWKNMFRVVGFAVFWFWIPAHTLTFTLSPEFRVMSAALLAIALGLILGMAKKVSQAAE